MKRWILFLCTVGCAPAWRDPGEAYGACESTCTQGQECIGPDFITPASGQLWRSGFCGRWCNPNGPSGCSDFTLATALTPTCFGPVIYGPMVPRESGICALSCDTTPDNCPAGLVCRGLQTPTGPRHYLCLPMLRTH